MNRWRRPLLRRHGRKVVIVACAWELVALGPGPVPTLSSIVQRYRPVGVVLLAGLAHHFFLEASDDPPQSRR